MGLSGFDTDDMPDIYDICYMAPSYSIFSCSQKCYDELIFYCKECSERFEKGEDCDCPQEFGYNKFEGRAYLN